MSETVSYLDQLRRQVEEQNFEGWDPYDGLNSRVFRAAPLAKSELMRLCWIQLFKRCPLNMRNWLRVPKSFNPKGGALFLDGYLQLYRHGGDENIQEHCLNLRERLLQCAIKRERGIAWGYNFDWQAKAFYVPQGTPNIVTTVFIGNALMNYAAVFPPTPIKATIKDITDFILNEMILWQNAQKLCFAYIPGKSAEVHNANLLAAAFLARASTIIDEPLLAGKVEKAVRFSLKDISPEGYWPYGSMAHHRWMDNFHTAYNLEALLQIRRSLNTKAYDAAIRNVFAYYTANLFAEDGTVNYYHNKRYPLDSHTIAVAILFFTRLLERREDVFSDDDRQTAKRLLDANVQLAIEQFWDARGWFHFQHDRWFKSKIPYIRWTQAWMFCALAYYQSLSKELTPNESDEAVASVVSA